MSDLFALIVEDETDLAIIFSKALQEAGFETQIVRAGDTALMDGDIIFLDPAREHIDHPPLFEDEVCGNFSPRSHDQLPQGRHGRLIMHILRTH